MTAPNITIESREEQEEYAAVVKQAMHDTDQELTRGEREQLMTQDKANFMEWDKRLWNRNSYNVGFNHFMSENSKQWGAMPGVNSGNGQFEGRMGLELFIALGAKYEDKDWWKDDVKFYRFLKAHPEMDGRPGKNNSRGEAFLKPGQNLIV